MVFFYHEDYTDTKKPVLLGHLEILKRFLYVGGIFPRFYF